MRPNVSTRADGTRAGVFRGLKPKEAGKKLSSVIFRKYHENHKKQREGMEGRKTHSVAVRLLTSQSQRTDNLRKKLYGIFHPTHKSLFCSF